MTIFFCLTTIASGYFYSFFRQISIDDQYEATDKLHIEVLHITATDGTPLKALLYINPSLYNNTDHSAPLVVCCHGLGDNYFAFNDLSYTLAKKGYVVICPEFRGHGSNPKPFTFGTKEPSDIIQWLDYAEKELSCVNILKSGIFGFSMGGYYATMAYILESLGKQRLQTLIDISGPVNITRNLSEITNDPDLLGTLPIFQEIEKKNAILFINSTFPKNILLMHGDADTTVDVANTRDFIAAADPYQNRTDMSYYIFQGNHHADTGFNVTTYKIAISWFDQYLLNKISDPSEITTYTSPISSYNGMIIYFWLLGFIISLILMIGSMVYVFSPQLFFTKEDLKKQIEQNVKLKENLNQELISEPTSESNPEPTSELNQSINDQIIPINSIEFESVDYAWKYKLYFFGIYLGCIFLAGIFNILLNPIIYIKIGIVAIGIVGAFFICSRYAKIHQSFEKVQNILQELNNRKNTLIFTAIIVIGLMIFLLIESNPSEIDATLGPGARFTWLVPVLAIIIFGFLECMIIFLRCFILPGIPKKFKERLFETIMTGITLSITLGLAFIWNYSGTFFGMSFLQMLIEYGFWIGCIIMIILHIMEQIHKSMHPILIFFALAVAIGIGASQLYLIF